MRVPFTGRARATRGGWPALGAVLCLFLGVTGYLLVGPDRAPATVRAVERTTVTRTARLTGSVVPTARFWLFFGRSAAAAQAPAGGEDPCGWFPSSPDPATGLGRIATMKVTAGAHVTAGTVIAEADTTDVQHQADQAGAELSAAKDALARDRRLMALLDTAPAPLAPPPPTAPAAASPSPAPPPPAAAATAGASTAGSRAAERLAATAQVAADEQRQSAAQARVDAANAALAAATVKAPVDGTVEQLGTAVGATPSCRFPVAVMRSDTVQVEVFASPEDAVELRAGQAAVMSAAGARLGAAVLPSAPAPCPPSAPQGPLPNKTATPCAPRSWLLPLPGPAQAAPGTAVTVDVTLQERSGVLAVPNSAVRHRAGGEAYVVVGRCEGDRQHCRDGDSRTVTTGVRGDDLTEITAGIDEDTVVIVTGD